MLLPRFLTYLVCFFDIFASGGKRLPRIPSGNAVDIQMSNIQNKSVLRLFFDTQSGALFETWRPGNPLGLGSQWRRSMGFANASRRISRKPQNARNDMSSLGDVVSFLLTIDSTVPVTITHRSLDLAVHATRYREAYQFP